MLKKEEISKLIIDLLVAEFKAQGHSLTGAFESGIETKFIESANNFIIEVYGAKYAIYLENGVKAAKIPYTPNSGAKHSKYIEALMSYARLRFNLSEVKDQKSAAFAIARKQKKEGMPTYNSYLHSKTGERTMFIDIAMSKFMRSKTPEQIIFSNMEGNIINMIRDKNRTTV